MTNALILPTACRLNPEALLRRLIHWWEQHDNDLSIETVRRVKRGESFDPSKRRLLVFMAQRMQKNIIWIRASVIEDGNFYTCSWRCHSEDEAVKWFNVYVELYGPPQRGEFLGFKYGKHSEKQVPETGTVPPMSCGS